MADEPMHEDDMPTDDERDTRYGYDGPAAKSVESLAAVMRLDQHERNRHYRAYQASKKPSYFGNLADPQTRQEYRHGRASRLYNNNMSDSDAATRSARFESMLKDAHIPLEDRLVRKLDNYTVHLMPGGRTSYAIEEHGARITGVVKNKGGTITVDIDTVRYPYELRRDDGIGKFIDKFIQRGNNVKVHTIVGQAMAASVFNRGFHVYEKGKTPVVFDEQTDYNHHNVSGMVWRYKHEPYNQTLRAGRKPVKFLPLNGRTPQLVASNAPQYSRSAANAKNASNDPYHVVGNARATDEQVEFSQIYDRKVELINQHMDPVTAAAMVKLETARARQFYDESLAGNSQLSRDERLERAQINFDNIETFLLNRNRRN